MIIYIFTDCMLDHVLGTIVVCVSSFVSFLFTHFTDVFKSPVYSV